MGRVMIDERSQRLILWKMIIELTRAYRGHFAGESCLSILVCMAVGIGHLEGRPLNASKIANILYTPRTTVLRVLEHLRERGLVVKQKHLYLLNEIAARKVSTSHLPKVIRIVSWASEELSKVDEMAAKELDRAVRSGMKAAA
jgi:DNA-binding IclR family transcriptional regulator